MKILILTQYFPPEVGAPQNRLFELALRLIDLGVEIEVLTAMPNYPQMSVHEKYRGRWYVKEEIQGIPVYRSYIFVPRGKSIPGRLLNYFSFVFTSCFTGLFRTGKYDFIFCESPPLFLGISGIFLSYVKFCKLIFNVADLWPESAEKLGIITNKYLLRIATRLELACYKRAVLITGQHMGIVRNIRSRTANKMLYWLPNGVDLTYFDPPRYDRRWREQNGYKDGEFLVAYAGIFGYAQALEVILRAAVLMRKEGEVRFILLGSGPEKEKLVTLNGELGNTNVSFFDTIPKDAMPYFLKSVDASIIPLKNIPLFREVVPSKIFENLAMKKPILLGIEGEAKELFIDEGKAGLAFAPEDENSLSDAIRELISKPLLAAELGENGRKYVQRKFDRNSIASSFHDKLTEIANR